MSNWKYAKKAIIFGVNNNLLKHAANRKEDSLVLVEDPTDGFDDIKITQEATYSIYTF